MCTPISEKHLQNIATRIEKLDNVLDENQKRFVSALNILVLGPIFVGKSTFINTLRRTFGRNWDASGRLIGNDHGTQELKRIPVVPQVNIWDTWGIDGGNYQDGTVSSMITGSLNDGSKMNNYKQRGPLFCPEDFISNSMHVCIICIDEDSVRKPHILNNLKNVCHEITTNDTSFLFVMTKADKFDPSVLKDDQTLKCLSGSHEILKKAICIATELGNDYHELSPIASYCSATQKADDMRSLLCLNILDACITMAKGRVDSLIRKYHPDKKQVTKPLFMKCKMLGRENEIAKKIRIPETYDDLWGKIHQIFKLTTGGRILNMEHNEELCEMSAIIDTISSSTDPNNYCFYVACSGQETYDKSQLIEVRALGMNVESININRQNNLFNMQQEASEKFGRKVECFVDSQQDSEIYDAELVQKEPFIFARFEPVMQNGNFYQPHNEYGSSYDM